MLDLDRRLDVLAAIGIDVYRLRKEDAAQTMPAHSADTAQSPRLVIAHARGARRDPGLVRLLPQVLCALAVTDGAVGWFEAAADGAIGDLPEVPAYLMFGAAVARACSAGMSIERQNAATIVVCDESPEMIRGALAKRALWQSLKPLARRLRVG
jgi:hypothetical protein